MKPEIETWFANPSLSADYGVFICRKCGVEFCYSPRNIMDGDTAIAACLCADCALEYVAKYAVKK